MHDMSYFDRSVPKSVGETYRKILGYNMFERVEKTIEILEKIGVNISHTVIPNIAHNDKEASELAQKSYLYKKC